MRRNAMTTWNFYWKHWLKLWSMLDLLTQCKRCTSSPTKWSIWVNSFAQWLLFSSTNILCMPASSALWQEKVKNQLLLTDLTSSQLCWLCSSSSTLKTTSGICSLFLTTTRMWSTKQLKARWPARSCPTTPTQSSTIWMSSWNLKWLPEN